jgi:tetratricopeptide (TPR) repeat protein
LDLEQRLSISQLYDTDWSNKATVYLSGRTIGMKWIRLRIKTGVLLLCLYQIPAFAASEFLKKAIAAYDAGQYNDAMGLLGEAESRDFNDPVLHYYLANTLARLDSKQEAVKEYKIALAMEPDGQMAQYCHDALRALGAEQEIGKSMRGGRGTDDDGGRRRMDPVKEAEMNDDKDRMDKQIDLIRQEAKEIVSGISRDTPDRQYAIKHFRDEAQNKIQQLRDQFMQKWHLGQQN